MKKLIINADDYGYAPRFNDGILDARITSASVMIERPFADLRLMEKGCGIGLHLELRGGDAYAQAEKQFNEFTRVYGLPTHLDSHKWVHEEDWALEGVARFAAENALPLRSTKKESRDFYRSLGINAPDNYFHSLGKEADEVLESLKALPDGVTEWAVHPGYFDAESDSSKNEEREKELELCNSEEVESILEGVRLVSYADAF
jgi:chitin disaccharide deacetylase